MVCPGMMLLLGRKSPSGGRMSRNGGAFGEEMHFFGGAGRVCPGFGLLLGRKSLFGGSLSRIGGAFGEKVPF